MSVYNTKRKVASIQSKEVASAEGTIQQNSIFVWKYNTIMVEERKLLQECPYATWREALIWWFSLFAILHITQYLANTIFDQKCQGILSKYWKRRWWRETEFLFSCPSCLSKSVIIYRWNNELTSVITIFRKIRAVGSILTAFQWRSFKK